jgi:hypothetical protein
MVAGLFFIILTHSHFLTDLLGALDDNGHGVVREAF